MVWAGVKTAVKKRKDRLKDIIILHRSNNFKYLLPDVIDPLL